MSKNLPNNLSLDDALAFYQEELISLWLESINNQPELYAVNSGKNTKRLEFLQQRTLKFIKSTKTNHKQFSNQLNELLAWMLAERKAAQIAPDLFSRVIFLLKEVLRKTLKSSEFANIETSLDLIGWGFLQRYYSEIVEILMVSNEKLADRTRELMIEEHKLATIIENISDGILVTDFDNKICQINKVAKNILGTRHKTILGKRIADIVDSPELLGSITEALDSGPGSTIIRDIEFVQKNKRIQFVRVYSNLALDEKKEPLGVISVLIDITKEIELETAKARFLNTAAHELRTPLTSILGFISLILEPGMGSLDETQRDFLESAYQNGNKLKHLINGLLDLSRVDAGKLKLQLEDIELHSFLSEVLSEFQLKAEAKGLNFSIKPIKNKKLIVKADRTRLQQIVDHLCFNAIKFTESGTISVCYQKEGGAAQISVIDTGPGIAKADQARIFARFHQLDSTTTKAHEGTGLGLAVTKELINLHGGTIRVESELGKGSSFIVTLPLSK